jgi:hypothetical protein
MSSASLVGITPTCSPSFPITRTDGALMSSFKRRFLSAAIR